MSAALANAKNKDALDDMRAVLAKRGGPGKGPKKDRQIDSDHSHVEQIAADNGFDSPTELRKMMNDPGIFDERASGSTQQRTSTYTPVDPLPSMSREAFEQLVEARADSKQKLKHHPKM